jgi:hypothetical protein
MKKLIFGLGLALTTTQLFLPQSAVAAEDKKADHAVIAKGHTPNTVKLGFAQEPLTLRRA